MLKVSGDFKVASEVSKFPTTPGATLKSPRTLATEETEKINFNKIINKIVLFFSLLLS